MKRLWLQSALALALAACSQSQSRQVTGNSPESPAYPARLPLNALVLDVGSAPQQPAGGEWRAANNALQFGLPGQQDLFALACHRSADGAASLRISRLTRAETGAKALFALIGNGHIARLPLDAVRAGETGEWRGEIPAADDRLDVLLGHNQIEATLPGGGKLMLPASSEPGRLLTACRAGDRSPAAQPA